MKETGHSFREANDSNEHVSGAPKPLTAKSACDLAATKLKLTPNEAMVSKAQEYAAANLIGAAGAAAEGGIQGSAANKLQNAINKLRDQMNEGSEDNQQFFEADTQVSPCLENPNLEECGGKVSLSGNQAAINTGVNVDGGGRGIGTPTSLTADLPDDANAKRIDSNDLGDSDANDRIAAVNSPNARNNKLESSLRGVGLRQEHSMAAVAAAEVAALLQELVAVAAEIRRQVLVVVMATEELNEKEVRIATSDLVVETMLLEITLETTEVIHSEVLYQKAVEQITLEGHRQLLEVKMIKYSKLSRKLTMKLNAKEDFMNTRYDKNYLNLYLFSD